MSQKKNVINSRSYCLKKLARESIQEFGEITTLHGIRYVTEPRANLFERICWIVAILASASWCGFELSKLFARWNESPVITTFAEKDTHITSVPFPAVTICPESKVHRFIMDVEENINNISNLILNKNITSTDKLIAETISMVCETEEFIRLQSSFKPTNKHVELIPKISPSLKDVFEECIFHYSRIDCDKIFQPVILNIGLCFTFNMLRFEEIFQNYDKEMKNRNDKYISNPSSWSLENGYEEHNISDAYVRMKWEAKHHREFPFREHLFLSALSGLQVVLKSKIGDSQQICSKSNSDNFKVSLHSPVEYPLPDRKYFYLSPKSEALVAVKPDRMQTDPVLRSPKYNAKIRGCLFPNEMSLFAFKNITKQNCLFDVKARSAMTICNCSVFYIPMKGPNNDTVDICPSHWEYLCRDDSRLHECLPSCNELRYRYHVTSSSFEYSNRLINISKDLQFSKLVIHFEEATFFAMRKSELYGITDLIANCGGLLSLFTGFSIISAVEICYFATLRFLCRTYEHQINQNSSENKRSMVLNDTEELQDICILK